MSGLPRGRIVRAEASHDAPTVALPVRRGPRVAREELEARERARRIVADAERAAAGVAEQAARDAREQEVARLTAQFLALRAADDARAERDLDRAIELAVVLAERIVGRAIALDPSLVASLAKQALAEARGARRRRVEAHPDDCAALAAHAGDVGLDVVIEPNEELARGSLVVHTDLGKLDARLNPQLRRLASALREALGRPG
jgi:flagellar biosynthesis/type III secretory pathway protein FliH